MDSHLSTVHPKSKDSTFSNTSHTTRPYTNHTTSSNTSQDTSPPTLKATSHNSLHASSSNTFRATSTMYLTSILVAAVLAVGATAEPPGTASTSIAATAASSVASPAKTTMAKWFTKRAPQDDGVPPQKSFPYDETAYPPPAWATASSVNATTTSAKWFTNRAPEKTDTASSKSENQARHPPQATAFPKREALKSHGGCKVDSQRCYYRGLRRGNHGKLSWGLKWHDCVDTSLCVADDAYCYIHHHRDYCDSGDRLR